MKILALPILFIISTLLSCEGIGRSPEEINCKYQGGLILDKFINLKGEAIYDVKHAGKVYRSVLVYQIDNGYEVGDTINRPCVR